MSDVLMPPTLKGGENDRIDALHGYLVILAQEINRISMDLETLSYGERVVQGARVYAKSETKEDEEKLTEKLNTLRSLIKQTADTVSHEMDIKTEQLAESLVAKSEFGQYKEEIITGIETTARAITESFGYTQQIEAITGIGEETASIVRTLNGQIKRGILTDPDTGQTVFGIAIGSELLVTGETESIEGKSYNVLSPGQTLGLYTDKGWQFWINGVNCGGFSSDDSAIHANKMSLLNGLELGNWQVTATAEGLGVRFL